MEHPAPSHSPSLLYCPRLAFVCLAVTLLATVGARRAAGWAADPPAKSAASDPEAMMKLFRALRPKVIIEVGQEQLNTFLKEHPEQVAIPGSFHDPRVAFGNGVVEMSARTKVLFFATRVSVLLSPQIVRGRLRLVVRKIRASGIPLPTYFHKGVADSITGMINDALDRNDLELTAVQVQQGLVRVTAQVRSQPTRLRPASARP